MKKKKYVKLLLIGIPVCIILVFVSRPLILILSAESLSNKEKQAKRKLYDIEYMQLFKNNIRNKIKPDNKIVFKSSHAIYNFIYLRSYEIFCLKVNQDNLDKPLEGYITVNRSKNGITPGVMYSSFKAGLIKFIYDSGLESNFISVKIEHDGFLNSVNKINKNIILYNFQCDNLSIDLNEDQKRDLVFETKDSNVFDKLIEKMSYALILLRKNESTYLVILTPTGKNEFIQNHIYQDLFEGWGQLDQ